MSGIFSQKFGAASFLKFFDKDRSVLGIDIGTSSLKIVQARKESERAVLETYGELSTSAYGNKEMGRASLLVDEKVSEMIADLKKEAGATATRGVVSIPLRYSFITVIEMPELSDKELADAIPYEARRYIPIALSDVLLDWWRIPLGENENEEKKATISILLVAVQREVVEKYRHILENAKIEQAGFEVEVFSAARLTGPRLHQAHLFIDIGALSTKISIAESGIIRAVHHVDRASQQLSLALSQSLGVDFNRAEQMKKELGVIQRPEAAGIRHTIAPLLNSIFDEADRLRVNYRRKSGMTVDKVFLLGGGSLMPGILDYAIEKLGIEVILSNPFNQFEYPIFLQTKLKDIAPVFTTAANLTLRALQEA
ncbi:MAG TPA: type IV pilus assembly protein PilM [Candidatus Paceibacterota bacterium]